MEIRKGLLYSKDHEWVKVDGKVVRIGISDYAQDQLGDIVYVELPEVDDPISSGDSFTVIESVKAASDVYSSVSGTIVSVNEKLEDSPELVNESPYDDGWIIEIELADENLPELLTAEEYERFIEGV